MGRAGATLRTSYSRRTYAQHHDDRVQKKQSWSTFFCLTSHLRVRQRPHGNLEELELHDPQRLHPESSQNNARDNTSPVETTALLPSARFEGRAPYSISACLGLATSLFIFTPRRGGLRYATTTRAWKIATVWHAPKNAKPWRVNGEIGSHTNSLRAAALLCSD